MFNWILFKEISKNPTDTARRRLLCPPGLCGLAWSGQLPSICLDGYLIMSGHGGPGWLSQDAPLAHGPDAAKLLLAQPGGLEPPGNALGLWFRLSSNQIPWV